MSRQYVEVLEQLTLSEKASLLSGADFWTTQNIDRLNIPRVLMCDGPNGLRKQIGEGDHLGINESIETICYPTASAVASSFDLELINKIGVNLGLECQAENVGMLLGAGVNIKRSPLCGRNFEYFSEDPYLSGKLASAYVNGLQSQGVAACVKHFAANNQESFRMSGSSNVDERTLREIYLPSFEMAVKDAKTRSIMSAYNAINGEFCSENKWLLTDVLRNEWGFDGFVVTDWGAIKDPVKGVQSGLDLVMPGGNDVFQKEIVKSVENGELSIIDVDKAVANILKFVFDSKELSKDNAKIDRNEVLEVATDAAEKSAVLLKNENLLPLSKEDKIAFIGEYAVSPRYQGSGSSHINVSHVLGAQSYAGSNTTYVQGFESKSEKTNNELLTEAVEVAKEANVAVLFVGLPDSFETEGLDRENLNMPQNQLDLIEAVTSVQPNTVVVLHGGSSMLLPFYEKVKSILLVHLGGQGVGMATARLLYGEACPSGKLAETWLKKIEDSSCYLNYGGKYGNVDYKEGIFVGYRYYDKKATDVQFPFGHGLSYTTFEYSNISISKQKMSDTDEIIVSCDITNTGTCLGSEVVQLYIKNPQTDIQRPIRELNGFNKITLKPGEVKNVKFNLNKRSFAYYEVDVADWYAESGTYHIEIGSSSRDIKLSKIVEFETKIEVPYKYTKFSPIASLHRTKKGQEVLKMFQPSKEREQEREKSSEALGEGAEKMVQAMMREMPLGALVNFGQVSLEQLDGMIEMLNN